MAIFIMAFFVIFFWAAFEQAGISLTFFAEEQTDRFLFGWEIPASYFQMVNAAFIVMFAPLFVGIWAFLGKRKMEPASGVQARIWGHNSVRIARARARHSTDNRGA